MPKRVSNPLTPKQRQARLKKKLESFGVKKIGTKFSESEREMMQRAIPLAGLKTREEFIVDAVHRRCKELGLSLAEINAELKGEI